MTVINFYHLTDQDVHKAAARLLEKVISTNQRAVVLCQDDQQCQLIDDYLWAFSPGSFVPHGTKQDGFSAHQPVWITSTLENPNQADILLTLNATKPCVLNLFSKCFDLFDGIDSSTQELARQRWTAYKNAGNELTYWQQDLEGRWVKKLN